MYSSRAGRSEGVSRLLLLLAAMIVAAVLAGCGDDAKESGGGGDGGGSAAKPAQEVSDEAGQEAVSNALLAEVELGELPKPLVEGLKRSRVELTQEQMDKALECWKGTTCTLGDGELTLGIADGFGGNTWRKFTKMEIILQALTHPEIGKYIYTDANFDLSKMQSNIRSLSAQNADLILSYDDFGPAVAPAFRQAQKRGAKVATYVGPVPDVGTDAISVQVHGDVCQIGKEMVDAAAKAAGESAKLAYFNGTPGNPQGKTWNKCADEQIAAKYPEMKVVAKADTGWTPAGAQKAASGVIAGGKQVDAILYDYADPMTQIVKAYNQANKKIPAFVTWTENNALNKLWEAEQKKGDGFALWYTNSLNWGGRPALDLALAAHKGEKVENDVVYPQPFIEAKEGIYQADKPGDFPGASLLVPEPIIEQMIGS